MEAVDQRLVRREHALIQLLDPPFDKSDLNPGYIKGYVPCVRENGGQHTHAAIWATMAFAALPDVCLLADSRSTMQTSLRYADDGVVKDMFHGTTDQQTDTNL